MVFIYRQAQSVPGNPWDYLVDNDSTSIIQPATELENLTWSRGSEDHNDKRSEEPSRLYWKIQHFRADSRSAPSQWEMVLLCNDVSHWFGVNLESALHLIFLERKRWFLVFSVSIFIEFNYDGITWAYSHYRSLDTGLFVQNLVQADDTDNIKAAHCCPFVRQIPTYRQFSNIRCTQSQNMNVSRLVLLLSLPDPMKPCVKLRMKM